MKITLPLVTVSEANVRQHWSVRWKRAKLQREVSFLATRQALQHVKLDLSRGITVTLTRMAKRRCDSDNCAGALKACRDGVADALGIDDGDARIEWRYAQERARLQAVGIEVTCHAETERGALEIGRQGSAKSAGDQKVPRMPLRAKNRKQHGTLRDPFPA